MFTAARPLDILVQLLLQVILQLGAKIRRVKEDGVRQLELSCEMICMSA